MTYPPFIRHELIGVRPVWTQDGAGLGPPWRAVEALAYDIENRPYSLDIVVAEDHWLTLEANEDAPTVTVGRVDGCKISVTRGCEYPVTVVDADSFGEPLIDGLVTGPAQLRLASFVPLLTEAELQWFDEQDELCRQVQVPAAELALTMSYGADWRIEASNSRAAALVLLESGLSIDPDELFRLYPGRFSNRARHRIRDQLGGRPPLRG